MLEAFILGHIPLEIRIDLLDFFIPVTHRCHLLFVPRLLVLLHYLLIKRCTGTEQRNLRLTIRDRAEFREHIVNFISKQPFLFDFHQRFFLVRLIWVF